ncbi:uncharacterized protein LOC116342245 isoform X2 [Contarinia nasturtii]|uniref:uncharacterized protein LOC116342245 isoform X2 n=1 Tax=Contarinia nasturtii TaxID=265458 RepID=UPI0012D48F81|nr:uncharacterized protein LOC116342245 isoform X2 [Contarinia nasturtii]
MKTTGAKPVRRSLRLSMKTKHSPSPLPKIVRKKKKHAIKFLALNDYCIDEICEWLPLKSLVALGMTCRRLQRISSSYFRRKIQLRPKKTYVRRFKKNFRNIMIYGDDINVFEYTANKFKGIQMKRVGIFRANNLTETHISCIDGIIKTAEIIKINHSSLAGGLYETLKHCSNMKYLVLKSLTECTLHGNKNDWLLQEYSELKYLYWDYLGKQTPSIPGELKVLFERNPNLKSLYVAAENLPFIRDNNVKMDNLIVKVNNAQNVELICNQLTELCHQEAIKSFYLIGELAAMNTAMLPNLINLVGICTKGIRIEKILTSFPHLKIIEREISSQREAIQLSKGLINVEEAYLTVTWLDFIVPFIRYTPTISKIYIDNTTAMKHANKLNLFELNRIRKKNFSTAKNLTIYLKEEAYLEIKRMSIGCECNFVSIKSIGNHVTNNAFVYTLLYN